MTRFDTPTTVEASVETLRELLIETGARLAERPLELFREIGPTECVDPGNRSRGTHYVTLSYNLPIDDGDAGALLRSTAEFWRSLDLELNTSRLDDAQPEILAGRSGYALRALAVPGSGRLNLAGDTPCLPLDVAAGNSPVGGTP